MSKQSRYNYKGRPQGARLSYEAEVERLRSSPTAKQYKFYSGLRKTLRINGIDYGENRDISTRANMSREIDRLIALCNENGIETKSSGKQFTQVITIGTNGFKGALNVKERLVPTDELDDASQTSN